MPDASNRRLLADDLFVREGEFWTIAYRGQLARLRDTKGLRYLAHLVAHPDREVHAADLASLVATGTTAGTPAGDAGAVLDDRAKAAYRRRLDELNEDLEEAERFHDVERAAQAKAEIDAVVTELARAVGLGGRDRRGASASERARLSVTKAIKAAIERIADANPRLGDHLRATIRTGTFCSYQPDPAGRPSWLFERAVPAAQAPERPPPPPSRGTPYVGREAERSHLSQLLHAAAGGRGGMVLLAGEPGAGKTRLTEEVAREARPLGFRILIGRCYDMQGMPPYIPFVEVFEVLTQATDTAALRQMLGDDAPEVAKLVPKLRLLLPDIGEPLALPPAQERRYLLNSLCDVLARLAGAGPVLLVLEDLHWADEPTLLLVEHLAGRLPEAPLMVLGTYRDVELTAATPLAGTVETLMRRRLADVIALPPLGRREVAAMLESLAGHQAPERVVAALHAETEGNPFFIEEVFSHLAEEGKLLDAGGRFQAHVEISDFDVPGNVRLVIERRLERLSDACRRALAVAAVAGRRFHHDVVASVGDLPSGDLLDALEEAERAHLVVSVRDSRDPCFAFAHELIRQTLLGRLSAARKALLHARVASAVEALHGDAAGEHAAELAHHLIEAGSAAGAAKTLRYLMIAGDRALEAAAFEDAARHFEAALGRVPDSDARARADLLVRAGLAWRSSGRAEEALAAWHEALALYEELGEADAIGRLCWEMVWQLSLTVRVAEAGAVARRGLAMLGSRVSADRARLLASAATSASLTGSHDEDTELLNEALELARQLDDRRTLSEVLTAKTIMHFTRMQFSDSADAGMRAAELLRPEGALGELTHALGTVPHSLLYAGRVDAVPALVEELLPLAERVGHLPGMTWGRRAEAALDLLAEGDIARFADFAERDLELCRSTGMRWASDSYTYLGLVEFWRGRWDAAEGHLSEAAGREITPPYRGRNAAYLFLVRAYAGERDQALAALEAATMPRAGHDNALGPWVMMLAAVEGLAVMGERERAASLYPLVVEALATKTVIRFLDVRLLETVAAVAAAAGDRWEAAERHFESALRLAEALPNRIEAADARRFYAGMLLRRGAPGDSARAYELLGDAVNRYRLLGMARHRELAESLLASAEAVARSAMP